jgi:hypothetical protein
LEWNGGRGDEPPVACRHLDAVLEASRTIEVTPSVQAQAKEVTQTPTQATEGQPSEVGVKKVDPPDVPRKEPIQPSPSRPRPTLDRRLRTWKLVLEVLVLLVGLIAAILALLGLSRK